MGAPVPLLPDLLVAIGEVAAAYDVEIPVVAHAGRRQRRPEAESQVRAAFAEVMKRAIALGGTSTGEHGVGRIKKAALPDQLGPEVMALTWRVKQALDPDGILYPGAIV